MSAVEELQPSSDRITCQHCHETAHIIQAHLFKSHPELVSAAEAAMGPRPADEAEAEYKAALFTRLEEDYKAAFPHAPLYSEQGFKALEARKEKLAAKPKAAPKATATEKTGVVKRPLYQVFNVTRSKNTRLANGDEMMVEVLDEHEFDYMVPQVDPDYVWDMDLLKTIVMAVENKIPMYLWGYAGVGKSTGFAQYCAATNRPMVRVQHTGDTESSHIIGQTLANEQGTYFNPGPLPLAMKHGWFYLADEYDFAFPQVTSVYQPVLENSDLYIKEAEDEWRMTHPHPNFFMAGTGNTNGAGDETGLFQGTNMQNAANYERYGVVREVKYLEPKQEKRLLSKKLGVDKEHIEPIVDYCNKIRDAYRDGKITNTAGQRVTLNMAKIYLLRGSFMKAAELSFINRLPESCRRVASDTAQRVFGE